jgi:DNA-binding NtrC family response regulator
MPLTPRDKPERRPLAEPGEVISAFLGGSAGAAKVRKLIRRAARVDSTVLITGESGVGKELVAREIYARSNRRDNPFVPLNCAAIAEQLIESELFGHEAGAFTDARHPRRGAFEMADTGTLFLDEVGDLSAHAQPKLLRAIETGEFTRVGGERMHRVDLRVIAATNHDLRTMSRDGRFRSDLYFRLCVLEIHVPPLRDRAEDIPELANHFARRIAEASQRPFTEISGPAMRQIEDYPWPGNVRELRAVIERALALSSGMVLDEACFNFDPVSSHRLSLKGMLDADWRDARQRFEEIYATELLKRHEGSVPKAARAAGLAPRSLYKMLQRLGLRRG